MILRKLKWIRKKERVPAKQQAVVLPFHSPNRNLEYLTEIIERIRPGRSNDIQQAELQFRALLFQLNQEKSFLFSFRKALASLFSKTNIVPALTESGILSSRGFVQELAGKIKHKFLPELPPEHDFLYVLNWVFYKPTDYRWVQGIDSGLWVQFFELLGLEVNLLENSLVSQLQQALQTMSYRVAAMGLEKEILRHYDHGEDPLHSFTVQNRLINEYLSGAPNGGNAGMDDDLPETIELTLQNCRQRIQWIRDQHIAYGTSLAQTFLLTRLQQQVERMLLVLDALDTGSGFNLEKFTSYFTTLVRFENRKYSVSEFISEQTGYLAYQVAEHGGRTGEKFITTNGKEYWQMFRSALGGGLIISFIAVIKNLLAKIAMAPAWHGFLYSVNYSLGFILIQDTGATLATKQPAYTANHVAASLDVQKSGGTPDLRHLAITIARVSRTQLASITGNLLVVFPLTYFLAWLFYTTSGVKIAEGAAAHQLLANQHPFHSYAWLYAAFAGCFLFASGLIAGYVENYMQYSKVGERLRRSGAFSSFGEKRRYRIIHYIENNVGSLAGNIALGFLLGMAAVAGHLFGLPFDIRHVTISAANTAVGFFGLGNAVSASETGYTLLGVAGIAIINSAVSFGLAFMVAVKSRGVRLGAYPELAGLLWRYLKKYPGDFIRPPKYRLPEQLN